MSIQSFLQVSLLLMIISGCRTLAGPADMPALITEPDASSRAALQTTLSELFGGIKIRLADDALTRSSLLILTTGANSALVDPAATGRIVTEPYRFRLVRSGDDCILIDLRDDSRHLLASTTCTPED